MQHKNSSLQKNRGLNLNFTGSGAERNNGGNRIRVGRRKAIHGVRLREERMKDAARRRREKSKSENATTACLHFEACKFFLCFHKPS